MVNYFVYQLDGYVGQAVGAALASTEDSVVVGTVTSKSSKPRWAKEVFQHDDITAVKNAILKSDVIVYDIPRSREEVVYALKVLLKHEYEEDKVLIGVSSILSWASSLEPKPLGEDEEGGEEEAEEEEPLEADPEDAEGEGEEGEEGAEGEGGEEGEEKPKKKSNKPVEREGKPLTWRHAAQRRPHDDYRWLQTTENLILQKGNTRKDNLKTYVVWPGVLYGMGEDVLHPLFKSAWIGGLKSVPVLEGRNNVLPMIHIKDLANTVLRVAEKRPEDQQAFLAVDSGRFSVRQIARAVSKQLQSGEIEDLDSNKYKEWLAETAGAEDPMSLDAHLLSLRLDIKVRFVGAADLELDWHSKSGFVKNISNVIEEFRVSRGVTPLRVVVQGPPASGKTFFAKLSADEYEIPHLLISDLIEAAKKEQSPAGEAVRTALAGSPRLPDDILAQIVKTKLQEPICRNQGWILDGFPKSIEQLRLLFKLKDVPAEKPEEGEEGEEEAPAEDEDEESQGPPLAPAPEVVVRLDAEDEFLLERVRALPEEQVAGTHNDEEGFNRRMGLYKEASSGDDNMVDVLTDSGARVVGVDCTKDTEQSMDLIRLGFGRPRNYDPSRAERERERRLAAERARAEEAARLAAEEEAERERLERAKREEEEKERLQDIAKQEQEQLETRSLPMRQYLVDNILPVLTQGLLETGRVRPKDPISYLAEYLFRFDPSAE